MKPLLVLCLGNEILSDDALGKVVAEQLINDESITDYCDVIFTSQAGFALLDLLKEREATLIVDTIKTQVSRPGTIHFFPMDRFAPSLNLVNSHQISLPTAVKLGTSLGYSMPRSIEVIAVEASDVETLSESMTEGVKRALPDVIDQIREWIGKRVSEGQANVN